MTLKVALDATYQRHPEGGIARYGRQLTAALRAREDVEVAEVGGGRSETRGTIRRRLMALALDVAWHPVVGRHKAGLTGADVYHLPGQKGPLTRGRLPVVVTMHDLVPLRYPDITPLWSRAYARATLGRIVGAADRILCNSRDTADDVQRVLNVSPDRIRVVPLGVDPAFFENIGRPVPLAEPYVLFIGSEQPRKNLERLQEAVGLLRRRGFPHTLVTAGADGWGQVQMSASFVRKLGKVSDAQLRDLYGGAACLAIPSLHEGFGLPALEAMAVGTPVVAANVGALPEVTGGAAVLVDPLEARDIADGLERAITECDILIAKGRERARTFTWERTAELTVAVYRELA